MNIFDSYKTNYVRKTKISGSFIEPGNCNQQRATVKNAVYISFLGTEGEQRQKYDRE